jgi:energy-coupling factor transporter transmembrane protein EcfT
MIHRLDPRSKLLAMFAFVFIIFLANDAIGYGILTVFTFLGVGLSRIKLSYFLKGLRPMLGLILFTVIFQMLFHNRRRSALSNLVLKNHDLLAAKCLLHLHAVCLDHLHVNAVDADDATSDFGRRD